jgi:hypothetical protein
MKPESEVLIVAALDSMITRIDNAVDQLIDIDSPGARQAENILLDVTIELNGIIDRLAEEHEEQYPRSGAV